MAKEAKSSALKKRTTFVGKIEGKNGSYFGHGNRTDKSKEKYTNASDRKYGASGMGSTHAEAIGSLLEGDWRMRHGRREAPKNAKFNNK